MKFEDIQTLAQKMVDNDRERDKAFRAYQQMYHNDWSLPAGLAEVQWIHKTISSDPHDAINAGVNVLSNTEPHVKFMPLANDTANKTRANMIENVLKWQLKSLNRRRPAPVQSDAVRSALTYAAIAMNVVDLDWQLKIVKEAGGNARRLNAARNYSRFMVNTFNPLDVHVRYSNLMPEAVLLCQTRSASSVRDEWGSRVGKKLDNAITENLNITFWDYMDYETRSIWCTASQSSGDSDTVRIMEVEDLGLPFLPWVALMGGSTLESDPQHQYHSMLYSVYMSGQWETQNVVETLVTSEAIARAAQPRISAEGQGVGKVEYDAMSPDGIVQPPIGINLKALPPQQLDPALTGIADRIGNRIDKSTVSRILMTGEVPSGTAFSSLNLLTQTAVGALKPHQKLAEQALSEMFTLMLLWVEHTGNPLTAYDTTKKNLGAEYIIEPDTIDPKNLYVECSLVADVPTDRQQRANTAMLLKNAGLLSIERGMEELGIDDPQTEMETIDLEKFKNNEVNLLIQQRQLELQMKVQQMQQQLAAMQAQQQQQAQAAQQGQMQQQMQGGGQGFNPAAGGQPPIGMTPGATREQLSGVDNQGNAVMQGAAG